MIHLYNKENLNGILHSLYTKDKEKYKNELTITSSFLGTYSYGENAFDFNKSTYWTAAEIENEKPLLTFCLKNYRIKLTGFELQTTAGSCRPKTVKFGESNDNRTFNFQTYEVNMARNAIVYNNFSSNSFSRCFQYIGLENSANCDLPKGSRTDLSQIELYGIIASLSELPKIQIPCTPRPFLPIKFISVFLLSLYVS